MTQQHRSSTAARFLPTKPASAPLVARALMLPFVLLLGGMGYGQVNNPTDAILRSMESGIRQGQMILEADRLRAEHERIKAETELLRLKTDAMREPARPNLAGSDLIWAKVRLQRQIPDIHLYWGEIAKLVALFNNPEGATIDNYLEGFYLIAKYASFSTAPRDLRAEPAVVKKPLPD